MRMHLFSKLEYSSHHSKVLKNLNNAVFENSMMRIVDMQCFVRMQVEIFISFTTIDYF